MDNFQHIKGLWKLKGIEKLQQLVPAREMAEKPAEKHKIAQNSLYYIKNVEWNLFSNMENRKFSYFYRQWNF